MPVRRRDLSRPGPGVGAGAKRADIGQTGEESWHVLADPEGNVFCLLADRVPPS